MAKDGRHTILIVEDDKILREAMGYDFRRRNYCVLLAENGTRGFELIQTEKVDLVISDVRMPNGDGIELLKNIRNRNLCTPIVLFITGFADLSLEDAYHEGANAVLDKPFDRKKLFEIVEKALLSPNEKWQQRLERMDTELSVELKLANLEKTIKAKVVNLGRGGMFIAVAEHELPKRELPVAFRFKFKDKSIQDFQGQGTIKWVRRSTEENLPIGFGMEFDYLDKTFRENVIHLIDKLATRSYIPKF